MNDLNQIGKLIILAGVLLICAGILLIIAGKLPFPWKLPGDIYIKKEKFTFYFPIVTFLVISLIISLIIYIFRK